MRAFVHTFPVVHSLSGRFRLPDRHPMTASGLRVDYIVAGLAQNEWQMKRQPQIKGQLHGLFMNNAYFCRTLFENRRTNESKNRTVV